MESAAVVARAGRQRPPLTGRPHHRFHLPLLDHPSRNGAPNGLLRADMRRKVCIAMHFFNFIYRNLAVTRHKH